MMKYFISGGNRQEVERRVKEAIARGHVQLTQLSEEMSMARVFNRKDATTPNVKKQNGDRIYSHTEYNYKYRVQMMIPTVHNATKEGAV